MRGSRIRCLRAHSAYTRRGAVAFQVAVCSGMLVGFAAMAIDVGHMYNARAELQRTADAAALAAAAELGDFSAGDPLPAARAAAQNLAQRNAVLGDGVILDLATDVEFGRAAINPQTGKFDFVPTEEFPNAVRVRAQRTTDSANGSVPLFFANIFGVSHKEMWAESTALLNPRDITIVADLSASHNDDSELRHCNVTDINLYDVWDALPSSMDVTPKTDSMGFTSSVEVMDNGDGTSTVTVTLSSDGSEGTSALSHVTFGLPEAAWAMAAATATSDGGYPVSTGVDPTTGVGGIKFDNANLGEDGVAETEHFTFTIPTGYLSSMSTVATKAGRTADTSVSHSLAPGPTFGTMSMWGGSDPCDPSDADGLQRLPYGQNWNNAKLQSYLADQGYSPAEISAIMSSAYDADGGWTGRTAVALGLAIWRSGMPGGLWEQLGLPPGNGNGWVGSSTELTMIEGWPYASGSWSDYLNYVKSGSSSMVTQGNSRFRYKFGVKTLTNYLLEQNPESWKMPELADTPHQPMQAVKDAAIQLVDTLVDLDNNDMLGLAGYGQVGYGPVEHPNELSWLTENLDTIRDKVSGLQAGQWTIYTNIAQGIDKGVDVLFNSPNGRTAASRVMILLTDGNANQTRTNPTEYNLSQARLDALAAAQDARDLGIRIYTISVGAESDTDLMEQIAEIGAGEWYHAEGSIAAVSAQLNEIFQNVGGRRSVVLIR